MEGYLKSTLYPHVLIAVCNGDSLSLRCSVKRSDTGAINAVGETSLAGYFIDPHFLTLSCSGTPDREFR